MESLIFLGMTLNMWIVLLTILVVFGLMLFTKLPGDYVFMGSLVVFAVTGVLPVSEALSSFGSESVVMTGTLFVIIAGLVYSGVLQWIVKYCLGTPKTYNRALLRLMLPVSMMSSVLSNTTVVALFLKAVQMWAKRLKIAPSKLLIPLSYASELQLFDSENVPNIGRKTVLSALIMLAMILLSSFNVLPLMSSCFLAAFAMIITRCCSIKQARESIDWSILMIFAGSVCMGMAIERVGLAELLADNLLALAGNSPFWVLTCICVCGVVLSEFVSNTAAAAILYPVAYQTALVMDVNPLTFCIGLLISVSLCFASPIGSPTHMLVYGPGGYRFSDFMRVGIIMNVIMLIATLVFTPMIFPF